MIKTPKFLKIDHESQNDHIKELNDSLLAEQAFVSPKYFYDSLGSKLFEAITCLAEYYPTRTEAQIFKTRKQSFARLLPHEATLIDLGAGNCQKAIALFDQIHPVHYVAIDISIDFLKDALETIQREYPQMNLSGIGMDFSRHLLLPDELALPPNSPKLFFYPGSSISNFTPEESVDFLKRIKNLCDSSHASGLLIGVDLIKDKTILEAAYDDGLGVTAAFNRNILLNINSILKSNFNLKGWNHKAFFNAELSRIEMHLEATEDVVVTWPHSQRRFCKGETIHTENSYKWLDSEFELVLRKAGFTQTTTFMDEQNWFSVIWAT